MAILHKKEEKIQAVLGRLSKKYTQEEFVAMFIKLYSKDWGKIKSAYNKQAQDKEPGTVINMPKPDLYLKQLLDIFLKQRAVIEPVKAVPKKEVEPKNESVPNDVVKDEKTVVKKEKVTVKKDSTEVVPSKKKLIKKAAPIEAKEEKISIAKKNSTAAASKTKTIKKEK